MLNSIDSTILRKYAENILTHVTGIWLVTAGSYSYMVYQTLMVNLVKYKHSTVLTLATDVTAVVDVDWLVAVCAYIKSQ